MPINIGQMPGALVGKDWQRARRQGARGEGTGHNQRKPRIVLQGLCQDRRAGNRGCKEMQEQGAHIIDVGAMSTAPYLETVIPVEEEIRRMRQAVKTVKSACDLPVSVDTPRASVAEAAIVGRRCDKRRDRPEIRRTDGGHRCTGRGACDNRSL